MAAQLHVLATYRGVGMPLLPLTECARALGLDGLAVSLAPGGKDTELLQHSGPLAAAAEELQRVQGQGPSPDAARGTVMVLIPDIGAVAADRWPGLPGPLTELGIAALFAFPLRIGVITLGVLSGYRTTPGDMTADTLAGALALADALSCLLIDLIARAGTDALLDDTGGALYFAEVHQATGMLARRHGITPHQALIALRAHAFAHERPLLTCARDVLHHRLHLDER